MQKSDKSRKLTSQSKVCNLICSKVMLCFEKQNCFMKVCF
jgi:hypothetical protein